MAKEHAIEWIEENKERIIRISDAIWEFARARAGRPALSAPSGPAVTVPAGPTGALSSSPPEAQRRVSGSAPELHPVR